MLVHNIKGTSDRRPKGEFDSWLDFWEKRTNKISSWCARKGCDNISEVGGHVQEHGKSTRNYWYIVPLCKKCNNSYNETSFEVSDDQLVRITADE